MPPSAGEEGWLLRSPPLPSVRASSTRSAATTRAGVGAARSSRSATGRERPSVRRAALVFLFALVLVSATGTATSVARTTTITWPPRIKPLFTQALPGEGVWRPTGPPYHNGPPVLRTFFRTDRANPSVIAYVAWYDHTRTSIGF